jgi:hypothetical protein
MITDSWKKVTDEARRLRIENAGWQQQLPSVEAVYEFGKSRDPEEFLAREDYIEFYGIFNAALNELQGLPQPDPLQKVRLQQLQVMRRDLMDTAAKVGTPPIRFKAAQLYLRQMLKPDQPLPTLFAMESPPSQMSLLNNPTDILSQLRDIQLELTVRYDPAAQELKRATAAMMDRIHLGKISAQDARTQMAAFHAQRGPVAFGSPIQMKLPRQQRKVAAAACNKRSSSRGYQQDLVKRATVLCKQVGDAFPEDAVALGCRAVQSEYDAETVINTVCDRIRTSVPSVTPEQFYCPPRKV